MVTLTDILHKISNDQGNQKLFNDQGIPYEVFAHHFHLCITDELEVAEENMQAEHGHGFFYAFHLPSYQVGYDLCIDFYFEMLREFPDMAFHQKKVFPAAKPLFLVFHVLPIVVAD